MKKVLITVFLTAMILSACSGPGMTGGGESDTILTLDKMSREQIHVFLKGFMGDWDDLVSDQEKKLPPPPIQKEYPAGAELSDGYDQASIDEFVGVDGKDEFVIYLSPAGKIAKEADQD